MSSANTMFEVGKVYHNIDHLGFRVKCLWADERTALMEVVYNCKPVPDVNGVGRRFAWSQEVCSQWKEYTEPRTAERVILLGVAGSGNIVASVHKTTDNIALTASVWRQSGWEVIGTKRITLTEGEFDVEVRSA